MAINLVTQEMMDLSSIKQDKIVKDHKNFAELFDDPDVPDDVKVYYAWDTAHFITLNGLTKADIQAMLRYVMEKHYEEIPAKPRLTIIEGNTTDEQR